MSARTVVIEPRSGTSIEVARGEVLVVEDLDGGQVADFVCFALDDHGERFSRARTRERSWGTNPSTGSELVSNRDNVMFTIVEDTVGVHDILFCPCHSRVYEHIYKVGPRAGCAALTAHPALARETRVAVSPPGASVIAPCSPAIDYQGGLLFVSTNIAYVDGAIPAHAADGENDVQDQTTIVMG